MDASLHAQSELCSLKMKDIQLFADGSGGVCTLEVISAPFSASIRFFFDVRQLGIFCENLAVIERILSGETKLGLEFEEPYISFHGNGRGHIVVSGLLTDTTEHMQELRFSFKTDKTSLFPFVASLREVYKPHAV